MAAVAEALIKLGLDDSLIVELVTNIAIMAWTPAHNTLNEYVEGAINQAKIRINATQKSLYTWVPPRKGGD